MKEERRPPTREEKIVSWVLLGCIAVFAVALTIKFLMRIF